MEVHYWINYPPVLAATKCFCEHEIGASDLKQNGIICQQDGKNYTHNYCADDEWCIGATDSTNSIYEVESLCVKGNPQ